MLTSELIKRKWKEERGWYQNPDAILWLRIGDWVTIGDRVTIGDWVTIGNGARIGDRVTIGDRAIVTSVLSKYIGTLFISEDNVEIRIGCECYPPEYWDKHGIALARRHGEAQWWKSTGKYMLEYLKHETYKFAINKLKRDSRGRFCK